MFHNIQHLWPSFTSISINCCRSDVPLYIDGETVFSQEGTTQGEPLAMPLYALGVVPLISKHNTFSVNQIWYVDNAAAVGNYSLYMAGEIVWRILVRALVTFKPGSWLSLTFMLWNFEGSNISITQEGQPYLGSPIGTSSFIHHFIV